MKREDIPPKTATFRARKQEGWSPVCQYCKGPPRTRRITIGNRYKYIEFELCEACYESVLQGAIEAVE